MCGFAGEYVIGTDERVLPEQVRQRANALRHRGPDDIGTWHDDRVGLAHVRLQLLDALHAAQPMVSERGTILSYNGEIYNLPPLRAELEAHGFRFRTRSDTEVLLAAYETWGTQAWQRLNGMFAFALYDPHRETLFLVRDRLGIKPLYYRLTPRGLEFGSEPSAWPALSSSGAMLNREAVLHFLRFAQPNHGLQSLFHALKALEPGTQLVASSAGIVVERWFEPKTTAVARIEEPASVLRARLRFLLQDAVERQMNADTDVGVFLSGGVDSAILAALVSSLSDEQPHCFSIALQGDEDELQIAALVAERWRCRSHQVVVSPGQFFAAMRELTELRNLPVAYPNEVLIYLLAQHAAHHVKAVLTGEGADELFGGYTRLLSLFDLFTRATSAAAHGDPLLLRALRIEYPNLDLTNDASLYGSASCWFAPEDLEATLLRPWRDALHHYGSGDPFAAQSERFAGAAAHDFCRQLLVHAHLPNLLSRLDGATMGASIEGRVPYTDNDLVEFALSLPRTKWYDAPGPDKPLLRHAFADILPPEVLLRPKRAFHASFEKLFLNVEGQQEIAAMRNGDVLFEIFDRKALKAWIDRNAAAGQWHGIWLLVSLSRWLSRNIM